MSTYPLAGRFGVRRRSMLAATLVSLAALGGLLGAGVAPASVAATTTKIGLIIPDIATPGTLTMSWSTRAAGTVYCSVDGGAGVACRRPHIFTGLSQASHTFAIKTGSGSLLASAVATPDAFDT